MHPQLSEAMGRLDAATRELREIATSIPAAWQCRKPAPDRWCVNEVLEHIGLVEQLFLHAIVANIETARAAGLAGEVADPAMLSEHQRTVVEDRSTRRQAPERVVPTGQVDAEAALARIESAHARLRDALASTDGLALSSVTHDHRIFGTLNVYQWVDFLAGHERRRLAQMREVATELAQVS